ncbi:hypothetical protein L228DRAFT_245580 [Xylona heveae TC161]|uniref:Cytochrome c oxidase-assembly factor COX23, mitochondrial n=1 Tax=Xylona heveae (strain CBS 132557 / TC161) TaxID=1328760 RepID=A0A165IA09_XYLHT|nr:hypothetical protein L228DRAFT_245580 [Xylona heveae TC161]KZF24608.1 hypothetical protein L228DRAFT_245580 [Xylona heveae TC161]
MSSESATDKPSDPWNAETKTKFNKKQNSEYFDPCQEAASRSIRCLHRNGADKDLCADYFQAYRDCKKQWINERKAARQKEKGSFL